MRDAFVRGLVAFIAFGALACAEPSEDDTAAREPLLWIPGEIDYSRFDALMAIPVRDAITNASVDHEGGSLLCGPLVRDAAGLAHSAVESNASIVTGIPRRITRIRTRARDNEGPEFYRTRYVQFEVTDATDIEGNPISLGPLWIQDLSEMLFVSPTAVDRIRPDLKNGKTEVSDPRA